MLIAAGFPVMIEASMLLEENFWYNDDRWSGHYLLLTGYNDGDQTFFTQDAFLGPNRQVSYSQIDQDWISFNRVFMLIYPADREGEIAGLLGEDWNPDINRQRALQKAQAETEADPRNVFAWFNLGSNLTYFERYDEAVQAYDQARQMNLPQRMLRYQFGPFLAYFHSGRNDDLLAMTEYALSVTPNSEEALLWRGWAQYRAGDRNDALVNFQKALDARPDYGDAQYAYNYVVQN
jgi:tetratricopeptide (TPR) repeat protein